MSQTFPLTVPDIARTMFANSWREAIQQKNSRLRPLVQLVTGCTGESATVDIIGKKEMENVTGQRYKVVNVNDVSVKQRYIMPIELQLPTHESKWDANNIAPLVAPSGKHAMIHTSAYNRAVDSHIISTLLGSAMERQSSGAAPSASALPAAQKIAKDFVASGSATDSNLTVAKLLEALTKLEEAEKWGMDQMEAGARLCIAVNSKASKSLLSQVESGLAAKLMSKDYMPPVLDANGHIKEFLGIHFVRTELVTAANDGTGDLVAYLPMWVSDSYQLNIWEDISISIDTRVDLSNAVQFLSQARIGGSRIEDEGVVQIAAVQGAA